MKATTASVDKVTKAKYGVPTIAAAASAEVAVKFKTAPTAKGGDAKATISGATDVGGFVYCALSKAGSRRVRMLNASNASNSTSGAKEAVTMTSASTKQKYTVKRATTTTKALTFSFEFTKLGDGKTHEWMCEATSLNPANPEFRSGISKGSVKTTVKEPKTTGDSALWSSLFAAIIMIAAVFFY